MRWGRAAPWMAGTFGLVVALAGWVAPDSSGQVWQARSAAAQPRVRVGSAPQYPARAHVVGGLSSSAQVPILIAVKPRDPAALASYASAVSEPGSSLYHRFLTVSQFRARFAPTGQQIEAVEASLRSHGLTTGSVSANGLIIPVTASAGRLAGAFGISFQQVKLASGRIAYANSSAPQFDSSVAGLIQGVIGLNTLAQPHPLSIESPHAARPHAAAPAVVTGGPQPCSAAKTAGTEYGSYTADQLANAYDFNSLYGAGDEGAGVRVALFELEPNSTSDIAAYQSCYGTSASVTYLKEDGGAGSGPGSGEAALDIEDVIGLAPKAAIDVYQAPNTDTGLIDNYTAIVGNNTDKVISTSWGLCEPDQGSSIISEEGTLFQEAATQGQSMFAASADHGSSDCETNTLAVDDPASQPYVTGVGGLTMSTTSYPPSETVWNESSLDAGAGGGGVSTLHTMPSYQSGAPASLNVINSHSSGSRCGAPSGSYCREVPDVSADADPYTGYVIYFDGDWTGIGGTSAAAPLWAAFTALVDASSSCAGKPIGFANPLLYSAAASAYSSDFTDVTSGNNDYTPDGYTGGLYPAGTAYDMASGLGSPNGGTLPAALCAGGSTSGNTVTVTNPGNQTSNVGVPFSLQITATDSASGQTLTYSATGLPAGLSINSSSGLISGSPTTVESNSVTVTAKDTTGASGSTTFALAVDTDPTGTTVSCAPNPVHASVKTTCTATVTNTPKGSVNGTPITPTGQVSFASTGSGSFPMGTSCTLSGSGSAGTCAVTYNQSSTGTPTITASYGGDSEDATSSGQTSLTVQPPAPTVTAVTPDVGPVAGGTNVTITGKNFTSGATVAFGSVAATKVTIVSATKATATSPAASKAGAVNVTVTTPSGTNAPTPKDQFAYGAPKITSFTPASGITGSTVTITGTGFAPGLTVDFGSLASGTVTISSPTKLTATVPNGDSAADITLTDSQGSSTSTTKFTPTLSITGFSPTTGAAGTVVTITGVGFNSGSTVKFNGTAATSVSDVSATELQATAPAKAGTGPITVTNTAAPVGTVRSAGKYTL